jgi:hypothetical protein
MMRVTTFIAAFLLRSLVGGGTVELVHRSTDQRSKLTFARKLKCQSLAAAYVKNDTTSSDSISAVDFSPPQKFLCSRTNGNYALFTTPDP